MISISTHVFSEVMLKTLGDIISIQNIHVVHKVCSDMLGLATEHNFATFDDQP